MRLVLSLVVCLMMSSLVYAEDSSLGAKPGLSGDTILGLCGARLAKVFDRLGTPENLRPSGDQDGSVDIDYGTFGLKIKNKTAAACFFWNDWTGPVKGIRIGDTKEQVLKILGKNDRIYTHADGLEDYAWNFKSESILFWAWFDKNNKVRKITAELD